MFFRPGNILELIIDSSKTRYTIILLIFINLIILILPAIHAVDRSWVDTLHYLDRVIVFIFVSEITLKILAKGTRYFKSWWNWFDFFVIIEHFDLMSFKFV